MENKFIAQNKVYTFFTILFCLTAFNSIAQDLIGNFEHIEGEKNITNLSGKFNDTISFRKIFLKDL